MPGPEKIPLFWWSETRLMNKKEENYGDLLSKYLVERISGKRVKWVQPKKQSWLRFNKQNYLVIGSILAHASTSSIVWGSGINDERHHVAKADFRAVRGPRTRDFLLQKAYDCPEVYGDPALLLPQFYNPSIEKKCKLGIIPHYNDYKDIYAQFGNKEDVSVINVMTNDVEATTRSILECEKIVSSSLHGGMVGHAYGIPSICVKFSNKIPGDGIKYLDYYESVGLEKYSLPEIKKSTALKDIEAIFSQVAVLPRPEKLAGIRENLMNTCPF